MAPFSPGERELLRAVRDLVRADSDMRRDAGARMRMNANELRAVRFVMEAARSGTAATPRGLATFLRVSTASTTTMLDRLGAAGHLDRVPHPTDRRSKVLVATPQARREAEAKLGGVHERMRAVAAAVP